MKKIVLALMVLSYSALSLAQVDEISAGMSMCGALTQMQTTRIFDIQQIETELLKELKNKNLGKADEKKVFELSERLDALRMEVRQLDTDLQESCD